MKNITADTTHEDAKNLMDQILAGIQRAKNIQNSRHTPEETKDVLANIIKTGENIMDEIQAAIISGKYELIEAGGKFLGSLASTIDVMAKFHQLDQKSQSDQEYQEREHNTRKEIEYLKHELKIKQLEKIEELRLSGGTNNNNTSNNTVIIATREEILDKLLDQAVGVLNQNTQEKKARARVVSDTQDKAIEA